MPKKFKIHLTRKAQDDLEHIFSYIASDNINNAKKFILELEEKIYSLDTSPERSPYIPENIFFGTNYRHLIHKKYRAIYKINNDSVYILRVLHGSKLLEL
ncbi:MAG: type II toxin-antitoxin system RelE/ParE family toxin [Desulfobulbaceae bacterium]|nr:type II toxin-antitoxin system RelE/ParE family toxin [Desulfobulbaceae bacterium]HIJ79524.1 type II toxin-antitoxin system RelE/ParE family toxin [Deltaproteobacteria bacterium]